MGIGKRNKHILWLYTMLIYISTWDKLIWDGGSCYVNGYFTDDNCTIGVYYPRIKDNFYCRVLTSIFGNRKVGLVLGDTLQLESGELDSSNFENYLSAIPKADRFLISSQLSVVMF
jgi:hypothetical protein